MKLFLMLLLALCQKDGDNYVIYINGVPVVGNIKILFKEVDTMREPSGIQGGIDLFTAGKFGVYRFTLVDNE